jgi:hypothetical protein
LDRLRVTIIAVIILLTAQGWTGDFANLFATFPSGAVSFSVGSFWGAVAGAGALVVYHAIEAILLLALAVVVVALSIRRTTGRLFAILGLSSIISAAVGGVLFVLSGYVNNANSAQMGGSFIGAYAFYFLALYATKN